MNLRERLRALIPIREHIHGNRWFAWLGPWLHQPKLWHWSLREVALGVARNKFFGLLIPIAQIPLSVAAAVLLCVNVPAATANTLTTNPVTFASLYYAAYRLDTWVTGNAMPLDATGSAVTREIDADASMWQRIADLGKPLLVGLSTISTLTGLLTYGLITQAWRWRTLSKRRNRTRS